MSHSNRKQTGSNRKRKLNKLKIKPFNVPPTKRQRMIDNNNNDKKSKDMIKNVDSKQKNDENKQRDKDKTESSFWEDIDINDAVLLNHCMGNDVEIIMNKLLNEFPKNILDPYPLLAPKDKNDKKIYAIPVILLTQIYSLMDDHTNVDQCIDKMKRENKIRHFRVQIDKTKRKKIIKNLNISNIERNRNDLAHKQYYDNGYIDLYSYTKQYNLYIVQNIQSQFCVIDNNHNNEQNMENRFCFKVLDKFMNNLLPKYYNHIISKDEIVRYLIDDDIVYDKKSKQQLMDKIISLLMSVGLIIQKMDNMYSFSYPKASKITRSIGCGRKEIIQLIWKRKYHEILKKEILSHKMRESCLDSLFHFRDLFGAQIIKQTECATGNLIQMA